MHCKKNQKIVFVYKMYNKKIVIFQGNTYNNLKYLRYEAIYILFLCKSRT